MRAYLLSLITGAVLGAGVTAGITSYAGAPITKQTVVTTSYPNTNPVITGIWTSAKNALCPLAEQKEGWQSGDCNIESGTVLSLSKGSENTDVSITFSFDGTYVKGSPQ